MDRLGFSSVLIVRLCCRHEFLSHGAGGCHGQLSDLFRTGNYSRCSPSRRSLGAKKALCAEFSKRSRAASQMRSVRRDRIERSEPRLPRGPRWRGVLHATFAESGNNRAIDCSRLAVSRRPAFEKHYGTAPGYNALDQKSLGHETKRR